MTGGAGAANQAWATKRQKQEGPEPEAVQEQLAPRLPATARRRLVDMDLDGVQTEVIYSELSFFRYWGDLHESQHDTTVAFNEVLRGFAEPDPARLVVSYQIPIQDIDGAMAEVRRVADARCEVAPAAGVPAGARAARLLPRALRPAARVDPGDRTADLLPHRAQHRRSTTSCSATPRRAAPSWCRWRC